jgi:hypothetical protein
MCHKIIQTAFASLLKCHPNIFDTLKNTIPPLNARAQCHTFFGGTFTFNHFWELCSTKCSWSMNKNLFILLVRKSQFTTNSVTKVIRQFNSLKNKMWHNFDKFKLEIITNKLKLAQINDISNLEGANLNI